MGRYLLTPEIFDELVGVQRGAGGEIQLTDGIAALLAKQKALAYTFRGTRYDCGSKLGYLQANVQYGLHHPEVAEEFRVFLNKLMRDSQERAV